MLSTTGSSTLTSGTLAGVVRAASATPLAATMTCRLTPGRPRSVGLGPLSSTPPRARAKVLSLAARDQSIVSAARRLARRIGRANRLARTAVRMACPLPHCVSGSYDFLRAVERWQHRRRAHRA
jgi:hypothetical protein